jgi:hypothetical protein
MYYLYGAKRGVERRLLATFDSQEALLSYVRWAILEPHGSHQAKFEQGSVLAGYEAWEDSPQALTEENEQQVVHSPTPTML